ncbi:hypothetical protein BDW02DRAFT_81115 [Decorospora gaudefroyi]|uniref:Uncharacterized protein n=1 Tax=Decorospora gaudefroyi TaxID=184978 RepID=A0A6A5K419_9PLEO|nr:hypothetical protein BDW02DRAFT_81115 [Decorospora gaudefroyi]
MTLYNTPHITLRLLLPTAYIVPGDPGYALLTNDPWYARNPLAALSTSLYHFPPPRAMTSGKTKWRAHPGRGTIGARSVILDDIALGNATSPASTRGADARGQMGHAFDADFDETSLTTALHNTSIVTRSLAPTPRNVMAQPSQPSVVDHTQAQNMQATPVPPIYPWIQPTGKEQAH